MVNRPVGEIPGICCKKEVNTEAIVVILLPLWPVYTYVHIHQPTIKLGSQYDAGLAFL